MPNFNAWTPGDILVFEALPNNPLTPVIEAYQKVNATTGARPYADCTHCAVYLGDGLIADARFRRLMGIRRLWPETLRRKLCVLRFDHSIVTSAEVQLFVEETLALEDVKYGASPIAFAKWRSGQFLNQSAPSGLVCSAVIEYAANRAGIPLAKARKVYGPMLPASLMAHPWLIPQQAEWLLAK
jgi:hypothetical protein